MTIQQALKSLPTLENEDCYVWRKHDLAIWRMYTDLNPKSVQQFFSVWLDEQEIVLGTYNLRKLGMKTGYRK